MKSITSNIFSNLLEGVGSLQDYIDELNQLSDDYHYHYGDEESKRKDDEIETKVLAILKEIPKGSVMCINNIETVSGYTSRGGYNHEYARLLKYTKLNDNEWDTYWGVKDDADMKITVLHSSGKLKNLEDAERDHEKMKGQTKSTHTDYAPRPYRNTEDPHWDGNFYGI